MATGKAPASLPRVPRTPNRALRAIRENERRETREQFAEAMARVARELGHSVYPDAKYVERLESGSIRNPGPIYRGILTRLCGRSAMELGFHVSGLPFLESRGLALPNDVMPGQQVNIHLRDAILASGMEPRELARKVGVDPKSVERWITKGRIPHPRHRWKACQILEREESELWPSAIPPEPYFPQGKSSVSQTSLGLGVSGVHPGFSQSDIQPVLKNMSASSAVAVIAALREVRSGYVMADSLLGGLSVSDAVRTQIPVVERACEVTRGSDRAEALDFACRFMEFCGWIHQDAGDIACAMFWTDRALDYAMELGDQRTIAYTLMRKSAIATEAGNPAQGRGIANFALSNVDVLTPRLRAVILRQRGLANSALGETAEASRDADNALAEAIAGTSQEESDRAPYCSPTYVAMETGASMVISGQAGNAWPVLAKSRSEWSDRDQARDYALCVSRLATAYAAAGEPKQACETAEEAIILAYGMGSRRVIGQLGRLSGLLGRWRNDPVVTATQQKLSTLVGSFQP
jgi:transcriptional regulator with XRE-family HTH domain